MVDRTEQDPAIQELLELEARRIDAVNRSDADALRVLLAHDYRHCHANAVVQGVDDLVANIVRNPRRIEPRVPEVRVYGDVAVLLGVMQNVRELDGSSVVSSLFVTQVAERRAGGWQFVWFQGTRVESAEHSLRPTPSSG